MPFKFERASIPDVILIDPTVYHDARGFFMETYKLSDFAALGIREPFIQHNHSRSGYGVLRGLHYQRNPKAQGKLLRVTEGEILDVAVDIRKGSPTYGKWVGAILSSKNQKMMYVPVGFAHGFLILSESADVLYSTTEEYSPQHDAGIFWNDPDIGIVWPMDNPSVSKKDTVLPRLKEVETGF